MAIDPGCLHRVSGLIAENMAEMLPGLDPGDISPERQLEDYGCNSVDRFDIILKTLGDLQLDVPLVSLAWISSIGDLASRLCGYLQDQGPVRG